jgi:outer membrane receptor protein involved in Fe transport
MRSPVPAGVSDPLSKATAAALQALGALGVCAAPIIGVSVAHSEEAAADGGDSDASKDALDQVVVNGVRPLISDKLPGDLQNTPQSVTVVSAELMQAQAATRLEDALKNVPGITLNAGEGAARGDTVNLRGFSAFNDFFLDGIRDAAIYTRDSFDLESVEVVKGPSAILFGRGSTGGAINQVSKAPMLMPLNSVTLDFGTNHEYRAATDIDVPLSPTAAFRFNAMGESSDVADRDFVKNRRWGVAPALALGIGEDAEPYFLDLGTRRPEFQELAEVARPLHHLTGDRAMDRDSLSRNVSENAVVGCRCAPGIVFGLQSIDRHGDVQVLQLRPGGTQGSERAGDNLHVDSARQQRWDHQLQFTIADQGVATDDRQVQRLDAIDNFKYSIYKSLASAIVQVAQCWSAAEMGVVIRVTTGAFQWAFFGNFDRKGRWFTLQDLAPCLDDLRRVHRGWPFSDRG